LTVRLRALVLAAGRGARLQPLTDAIPKPLLPVAGEPVLGRTLRRLADAGCEAAAINLHHRAGEIRRRFGQAFAGLPLTWSEETTLLGTWGALRPLRGFFAGADLVLIVNGDSLCRWPLAELVRRHLGGGAAATLLLSSRADPAEFGGGVALGRGGAILSLRPAESAGMAAESGAGRPAGSGLRAMPHVHPGHAAAGMAAESGAGRSAPAELARSRGVRRRVFAGAHVLAPWLLERIEDGPGAAGAPSDIVHDLYEPLLVEQPGSLATLTTGRHWHDLGTPRRYLAAALDWAAARGQAQGCWISPAADVSRAAAVQRSSVEAGCRIGEGAAIEGSVLLPGAVVGAGALVRASILGPGVELPAGSRVENQLVTADGGHSLIA
jgi:mannose-1-phosphate guanylyltransferase